MRNIKKYASYLVFVNLLLLTSVCNAQYNITKYVKSGQTICLSKVALVKAREYIILQDITGLMKLYRAQLCFAVPKGNYLQIPSDLQEDSFSGGVILSFVSPNGTTLWVSNYSVGDL